MNNTCKIIYIKNKILDGLRNFTKITALDWFNYVL